MIWTLITDSISYDSSRYAKGAKSHFAELPISREEYYVCD